jgi:hypothetical protein
MIITIKNFGPIKEFEFDTDTDFMLMVGENNVGKSYAITLVYLVIKSLLPIRNKKSYISEYVTNSTRGLIKEFEQQIKLNNPDELDISEIFNEYLNFIIDQWFLTDLNEFISNTFGGFVNINNKLSNEAAKISLSSMTRKGEICFNLVNDGSGFYPVEWIIKKAVIKKAVTAKEAIINLSDSVFFYTENRVDLQFCFHSAIMDPLFFDFYYGIEDSVINCYYLPASRSGLFLGLNSFGPMVATLSKNRFALGGERFEIPAIPKPLSDYYLELVNIKHREASQFSEYSNAIEQSVLNGSVEFDDAKKVLIFNQSDTDLSLDLSLTSSMVSEVSPVVAYLKYVLPETVSNIDSDGRIIIEKPLVILEEPEAHIHPVNQIKLIKVLAKLVKDGKIKLIITSHSNYLFNQCSNLVMDGSIDKDSFRAVLLKATETGSEAVDLEVDEYGVRDENFVDTAEAIFEEKLKLFDKINGIV